MVASRDCASGRQRWQRSSATPGKFAAAAALASVHIAGETSDIGACAKCAIARPGHDDDAHCGIGFGLRDRLADL